MVADGDRRDHDHAVAWPDDDQAWVGNARVPWRESGNQEREGRQHSGRWRPADADASMAVDAARYLWGSRSIRKAVLEQVDAGHLLRRRRRQARSGRLLLA